MNENPAQHEGGYPPVPQHAGNPNSGCALAAACVAFIFSVVVFSNFVFVRQEQKLVAPGGFFSSAKYETVTVISWVPVIFFTAVFCAVIYGLVLWKRGKPFILVAIIIIIWTKYDARKRGNAPKPAPPSFPLR